MRRRIKERRRFQRLVCYSILAFLYLQCIGSMKRDDLLEDYGGGGGGGDDDDFM